jgi:hypothetical protein
MPLNHTEATPVIELRCRRRRAVIGWLYRWNTGEHSIFWLEQAAWDDIEYCRLPHSYTPDQMDLPA